jgi:hypothetical protein
MSEKKFSVATVFFTAAISFLVSGVGGAAIAEWLSRPKPLVTISSVGFSGSKHQVPINDSFIKSTSNSDWIRNYQKFEPFDAIASDYEHADRIKRALENGLTLVNEWLQMNEKQFASRTARLSLEQIVNTPYMLDGGAISGSLIGMARRGELGEVPVELAEFSNDPSITEIADNGEGWIVYLQRKNVMFPYAIIQTATEQSAIKQLAYSFAYGIGPNLIHFMKRFRESANEDIRELIEMRE